MVPLTKGMHIIYTYTIQQKCAAGDSHIESNRKRGDYKMIPIHASKLIFLPFRNINASKKMLFVNVKT